MKKSKLNFDTIFSKSKVVLAPMAGITSFAYRDFMSKFGTAIEYSEMISDCGLIYGNEETTKLLYTNNKEHCYGIQLFGGSKEKLCEAIKILEKMDLHYDILDLNLGCPVYKVTRNNGGSSWLKRPSDLRDMVAEVVNTSSKPVSAKIRLGWDDNSINVYEIAKILEESGVSLITIHCRTTKQGYTGKANYDAIKDIKKVVKIPVVVSGDIFSVDDAKKAFEITKCDAVAVARGGVGNPNLVKDINGLFIPKYLSSAKNFDEQKAYLLEYMDKLIAEKGEELAVRLLRGIAPHFFASFENSKTIRQRLSMTIKTREDIINILNI